MFGNNLFEFEARQEELCRQAAEYRLANSLSRPNPWKQKVLAAVGQLMVESGQQLLNRNQTTQSAQC